MIGRSYDAEPKRIDPRLQEFGRLAAALIALQADTALEDVSGQGFRTRRDQWRGRHFEGTAYAQRAYRTPNANRDTTFEYTVGDITDAKRGNGIKFPKIGREHLLVMQGVHRLNDPAGKVAYKLRAGLDDGEAEMAVLSRIGSNKPKKEALRGVEAWERALPLIGDLPGAFEGRDPYRVRGPEEPLFPQYKHVITETAIAPLLEEMWRNDPDAQAINPYGNFPHYPGGQQPPRR